MRRAATGILGWLLLWSTTSYAGDHLAAINEYARIVGDAAVASKRCNAVAVDWARLAVEGRLRAVGGDDIFTLRALAQKRIDVVSASLTDKASLHEWCDDALVGYGPGGLAVDGLLVP